MFILPRVFLCVMALFFANIAQASIFSDDYNEPIKLLDRPMKHMDMEFPSSYRTLGENFDYSPYKNKKLDLYGLDKLNISGSAQFTIQQLENIVLDVAKHNPKIKKLIILDLRQESHGFIDGKPFRFHMPKNGINTGVDPESILERERKLLDALINDKSNKQVHVRYSNRVDTGEKFSMNHYISFQTTDIKSESEVVDALYAKIGGQTGIDITYERFYVLDHSRPSDNDIDRFIDMVESMGENTWIHMHCAAGKGRTTTFMSIADMLQNAPEIAFEDVLKRQHLIGGSDLLDVTRGDKEEWRIPLAKERLAVLEKFYNFMTLKEGLKSGTLWSEFVADHKSD